MEFEALRTRYPAFDIESLEAVASTLRVSLADSPESLPEGVRSPTRREGRRLFWAESDARTVASR